MVLVYSSYKYLFVFLGAVFILYNIVPLRARWAVLLGASCAFYLINCPAGFPFILATCFAVWLTGLFLGKCNGIWSTVKGKLEKEDKKHLKNQLTWLKRGIVAAGLTVIFAILAVVKYSPFVMSLLPVSPIETGFKFIVPLGISYYTLQAASYIIDVYRSKVDADKNFFRLMLFLTFFPQIVEGPIGRYSELSGQLWEGHRFDYDRVGKAMQLIGWGLLKKMVIADRCNIMVAEVFENWQSMQGCIIFLGAVMYTLQIYAEFSGCMDIVRGSAELFGIELRQNFKRPFFADSVNEFWRRWHITLGAWLRDYIFYTVSLSKVFSKLSKWARSHLGEHFGALLPSAFALFFVWLGNGIWHGAGWKYLAYGMYYFVIMLIGMLAEPLISKFFSALHIDRRATWVRALCILRTALLVVCGMMMFRAASLGDFIGMFGKCITSLGFASVAEITPGIDGADCVIIAVAALILLAVSTIQEKRNISIRNAVASWNIVPRWAVYAGLIMFLIIFGAYGAGYSQVDFIYGQF